MKYIGPDFCNITSSLSDEELLIQKTANEFVSQEFLPVVNEYYEKVSFTLETATVNSNQDIQCKT